METSEEMVKQPEFKKQSMGFFPRQILLFFSSDSSLVVCCYAMRVGRKETTRVRTAVDFFLIYKTKKRELNEIFFHFYTACAYVSQKKEQQMDWRVEKKARERAE